MYREAPHTPLRFRSASALAIALSSALFAAGCGTLGDDATAGQSNLVVASDDFESGSAASWDPNNDGSNWSVLSEAGGTNDYYQRATTSTAWSDVALTPARNDATVVVSAMVRINTWNTSTQNRVYLFARANATGSTDTTTAYQVAINSDSSITLERRGAGKAMTSLLDVQWMDVVDSWDPGMWNRIQIQVGADPVLAGHTMVAMYVNGMFAGSYSEANQAGYGSGNVGFGTAGASADFDDVKVGDAGEFDAPESDIVPVCRIPGTSNACNSTNACVCNAVVPAA